jgi:hypothetical protein
MGSTLRSHRHEGTGRVFIGTELLQGPRHAGWMRRGRWLEWERGFGWEYNRTCFVNSVHKPQGRWGICDDKVGEAQVTGW